MIRAPMDDPERPSLTRTIARNSAWMTLDTVVGFVTGLTISIAVARSMTPDRLGYYQYVLWVAGLAITFGEMGVASATSKYMGEAVGRGDSATALAVLRATFRFQLVLSSVLGAVGLTLVWALVPPQHRPFAALVVLSVVPALLLGIRTAVNNAREDLISNARASVISTMLNLIGVVSTLVLGWGLVGLSAALLVTRVADVAIRALLQRRWLADLRRTTPRVPLTDEHRRRIVRFCWQASLLLALDVLVWDRSDVFFLERMSSMSQVAFYTLSFGTAQHLLVLPRMFSWATGATLMVQQGRGPEATGRLATGALRFTALMAVPLGFGVAALATPLVRTLYGARYEPAIPALVLTSLFSIGKAMMFPATQLLVATDRQRLLLAAGFAGAGLNVALDLLLIPRLGAVGAAIAKGVTFCAVTTALWRLAARSIGIAIPMAALLRLLVCGVGMAVPVAVIARLLPPVAAIAAGVPVGALVFVALLRWSRYLDATDRDRLLRLRGSLPGRLARPYTALVGFVAASEADQPPPAVRARG